MTTADELIASLAEMVGSKPSPEMSAKTASAVGIAWEGSKIILPEVSGKRMTYKQARDVLLRKEKEEETEVSVHHEFEGYPLDGARALSLAVKEVYGLQDLKATRTMFGVVFPELVSLEVAPGEYESVPWSAFELPGIEGRFNVGADFSPAPKFILNGQTLKKHEPAVNRLAELTREYLRTKSVYRGKAIKVDLSYARSPINRREFNPATYVPQFMKLAGHHENELIVDRFTESALEQSLYARIEYPQSLRDINVPVKHGVLLEGPYGVGKTLLALILALKSVRVGYTFVYLRDAEDLVEGLRFARTYSPAVLFAEDVDKVMDESKDGRPSAKVQGLLNALDGIDNKDDEILVVLTTNRPAYMYEGLLRAGRVDTAIQMTTPDAPTAARFVTTFGGDLLHKTVKGESLEEVGRELQGYAPAFIREAINKAKVATVYRLAGKSDIRGEVTAEDLINAARMLKRHVEMARPKGDVKASPADAFVTEVAERVAVRIDGKD